jgi:integrase/recombinase XerD
LEEYLRSLSVERGLSPNTCRAYASDLRHFLRYLDRKKLAAAAATPAVLSNYLWDLKTQAAYKTTSLARKMEALRSFYSFEAAEGRIKENPARALKMPRQPLKLPHALSGPDIEALWRVLTPADSFDKARLRAIVELLYATGMRVTELASLKPESVNVEDGWIKVFGKGSKERLIPVHRAAIATLKNYMEFREKKFNGRCAAQLFLSRSGSAMTRIQVWRDLRALGKRAKLGAMLHPHALRHTFATHLLQGGADLRSLQEMLGHASLSTTQIYTHLDRSAVKESHHKFHPRP